MKYRYLAVCLLAGLLLVLHLVVQAVPQNFQNDVLQSNANDALALEFLPDGRMLVVGRLGTILVSHPSSGYTQLDPTPFLQLTNISNSFSENGVFSITLDPDFAQNGHYYVFYTALAPQVRDRVSRFTAVGNTTDPSTELVIWQDIADPGVTHHGGSLAFGPDGYLYFSLGDQNTPGNSQQLNNPRGKILRIAKDGTIPTTNPFFDGPGPNSDAIWAYGLRNPFRIAFDKLNGRLYIADVGGNNPPTAIEEVNLGVAGANYGWPLCEGNCGTAGLTGPIYSYTHANGTGGFRDASITGGFVYYGNQFPASYYGTYFFGDHVQNWIKGLRFDSNGNVTGSINFEPENGMPDGPYGNITDLKQGPEGALYYVDFVPSSVGMSTIRRISYTAINQPPVVMASADPDSGTAPLTVSFSSAGTFDPEGQALTYTWTFGDLTTSTEPNPVHTYSTNGEYTARLSVSDGNSITLSAAITISVGNPPLPLITTPVDNSLFRAGDTINFAGNATDPEDGTIGATGLSWNVLFHHDTHIHPGFGPFTGAGSGSFEIPITGHDFHGNTRYEIVLTATDSDGLRKSASVFVYPEKVDLTFVTNPSGLRIIADGIPRVTPFTLDALIGFHYVIDAPNQGQNGTLYTFGSWSDGGSQQHTIVVPAASQTYIATFTGAPGPSGLVAAYGFNEGTGTTTADFTGNGHTANLFGATWTAGRYGQGLAFNGSNQYVAGTDIDFPSGPFTLSGWFKTSVAKRSKLLSKFLSSTNQIWVMTGNTGRLGVGLYDDVGWQEISPTETYTDGLWHHFAMVVSPSTIELFVDGASKGTDSHDNSLPVNNVVWNIGRSSDGNDYFQGSLDEIRFYNKALTPAEVVVDMNTALEGIGSLDNEAPSVALTAPANGAAVSGTNVSVTADAFDNVAVVGVQFKLDGSPLGPEDQVAPYSISWDTIQTLNGDHEITAVARDAAGNTTTSPAITITVNNPQDGSPPVLSNGSPAGTLPAGTTSTSMSVSSDENATCRWGTVAGTSYSALPNIFTTTGGMNHSTAISGLTDGSPYNFYVRCQDGIGNVNLTDYAISFSVATPAPASGLRVAYAMDEGTGLSAMDASGNGNVGTLVGGLQWVPGHFGNGLSFDGVNDQINAGSAAMLDNLPALTVSAWVNPRSMGGAGRGTIATKSVNGHSGGWRFRFSPGSVNGLTFEIDHTLNGAINGTWAGIYRSTVNNVISLNQWTHVAATWDGTSSAAGIHLYVNGIEASYSGNSTQTNGIQVSDASANLLIGLNAGMGAAWDGFLDEVKIFNRVLTPAEVVDNMNSPIGTPPPDTQAPSVMLTAPSDGATVSGISVTVSAQASDNVGVVGVQFKLDGVDLGAEDTAAPYSISWNTTQASNTSHTITAVARDAANNASTSAAVMVTVNNPPPDTTPPVLSNGAPTGTLPAGTTSTSMSVSTNENATCKWGPVAGTSYASLPNTFSTTGGFNHSATVNGLINGNAYNFYVRCQDGAGNVNLSDYALSFTVANLPPPPGLRAAYGLNEGTGTITTDSSGNNNTGSLVNGPLWLPGQFGTGLSFDAVNDHVNAGSAAGLDNLPAMSISAWINPRSTGGAGRGTIATKSVNGPSGGWRFRIAPGSSSALMFEVDHSLNGLINGGWAGIYRSTVNNAISFNQWTHVTVTWDGSNSAAGIHIYVNGVEVAYSGSSTVTNGIRISDAAADLLIGSNVGSVAGWDGLLDEVRIFDRVLSPAEIANLLNSPL